jgi:hypothetical protein
MNISTYDIPTHGHAKPTHRFDCSASTSQPCLLRQGALCHGRWSHLRATYFIMYGESLLEYTKYHLDDSTTHG